MIDIIMNDVIHSTNSHAKLFKTQSELTTLFGKASMNVHKWVRHCSRYGCPDHVYSDNGSNFVGLNNELQHQYQLWTQGAREWGPAWPNIKWRFAPPYSPSWNGHIEVMVKIFKKTLRELMTSQTQHLRSEEFLTLCTLATGMMNRRPLVQLGTPGTEKY